MTREQNQRALAQGYREGAGVCRQCRNFAHLIAENRYVCGLGHFDVDPDTGSCARWKGWPALLRRQAI